MTPTQPTPEEQVEALDVLLSIEPKAVMQGENFQAKIRAAQQVLLTRQSQERAVREQLRALVEDVIAAQGEGTYPQTDYMGERLRECVAALAASPGKGAEEEPADG